MINDHLRVCYSKHLKKKKSAEEYVVPGNNLLQNNKRKTLTQFSRKAMDSI